MAVIACPDCKNTVSDVAESCPHCGRPSPGKSVAAIEADNNNAIWGIIWIINFIFVFWRLGWAWAFASLIFGPFIWPIWWLFGR